MKFGPDFDLKFPVKTLQNRLFTNAKLASRSDFGVYEDRVRWALRGNPDLVSVFDVFLEDRYWTVTSLFSKSIVIAHASELNMVSKICINLRFLKNTLVQRIANFVHFAILPDFPFLDRFFRIFDGFATSENA